MAVDFKLPAYGANVHRWNIVDDTQSGQKRIKEVDEGFLYLPFFGTNFSPINSGFGRTEQDKIAERQSNISLQENLRYSNYLHRAIFYNYISRTVAGLTGLITKDKVVYEADSAMEYVADDIDGGGLSLDQQMKRATELVVKHARCGMLVDFPTTEDGGSFSQKDINNGMARAYNTVYRAGQIINWRTSRVGSQTKLTLVVLAESSEEVGEDGFEVEYKTQYRELRLINGIYTQSLWDEDKKLIGEVQVPKYKNGSTLDHIPFHFVGAVNNDSDVDESILYDMAEINVGHYRNSADYENTLWLCGQPTPWMSGIDEQHLALMGGVPVLGSGSLVPVPAGERFGIEQIEPNQMSYEGMGHKQDQLIALGVKAMGGGNAFKTATEASINNQSETSFIQGIKDNVVSAYQAVLVDMELFNGGKVKEFKNPTDLSMLASDPQMLAQVVNAWGMNLIAKEDARDYMRRTSAIKRSDQEIDDDIELEPNKDLNLDG